MNTLHKSVYTITPWNQETSNRISIYSRAVKKKRERRETKGRRKKSGESYDITTNSKATFRKGNIVGREDIGMQASIQIIAIRKRII